MRSLLALVLLCACTAAGDDDDSGVVPDEPTPWPLDAHLEQLPTRTCAGEAGWTEVAEERGVSFFSPKPEEPPQWIFDRLLGGGLVVSDLTGDHAPDLVFSAPFGENRIYINDGAGHFEPCEDDVPWGARTQSLSAVDIDGDGLRDLGLLDAEGVRLVRNLGDCRFGEPVTLMALDHVDYRPMGLAWTDFDGDGLLDVHVAMRTAAPSVDEVINLPGPDRLYRGLGGWAFEEITKRLGDPIDGSGHAFVGSWMDADDDGDLDLHVTNDHGEALIPNRLWLQDEGAFTEASEELGFDLQTNGMGAAWGQLEPGGPWVLGVSDTADMHVLRRDEGGPAVEVTQAWGLTMEVPIEMNTWAVELEDLDHDGVLELIFAWGWKEYDFDEPVRAVRVWRWTGSGLEQDGMLSAGTLRQSARGVAPVDLDGDGTLELVVSSAFFDASIQRGPCAAGAWIEVGLVGPPGNRDGLGARVQVEVDGRTWWRRIGIGSTGVHTARQPVAHFGLADADAVDRLTVIWPDGSVDNYADLPVGLRLRVHKEL